MSVLPEECQATISGNDHPQHSTAPVIKTYCGAQGVLWGVEHCIGRVDLLVDVGSSVDQKLHLIKTIQLLINNFGNSVRELAYIIHQKKPCRPHNCVISTDLVYNNYSWSNDQNDSGVCVDRAHL